MEGSSFNYNPATKRWDLTFGSSVAWGFARNLRTAERQAIRVHKHAKKMAEKLGTPLG